MQVWWIGLAATVILFQIVAIPALILKKNDLADVLWGPGFPLSAAAAVAFGPGFASLDLRNTLILILISIWAARLFAHVGWRNLSHRQEDVRYNNWRKQWGNTAAWRSYLQVFVLQALIMYLFLTPILLALASPSQPMSILAWLGIFVWLAGVTMESIADEQLRRFKANSNNRGKLMTTGLWSWSRHPNYFGEVLSWWGIWLMVLDLKYGWATIVGPIGITLLILYVSGVSMLEALMEKRPGFEEYKRTTSKFFPLPPRR